MVQSHVACKKMATLDDDQVAKAAKALVTFHEERGTKKKGKKDLLDDEAAMPVFMQFSVKRIPKDKNQKYLIKLPHIIQKPREVCLITRDRKNLEPELPTSELYYRDLLKKKGVTCVNEVISYNKLSKEYKQYESKLRLLKSFDLFLSDRAVTRLLPSHLGKHFYAAKKFPIDVNLEKKNLKEEFQRVMGSTRCTITGHGSCSSVMVGSTSMTAEQVKENVLAVAKELGNKIEFGWSNMKSVSIKSQKSPALPVYVNMEPLQVSSETIAAWRKERIQNQEDRQASKKRKNRKKKRKPKQAAKTEEATAEGKKKTPEEPGESKKQKKKESEEGKENTEEGPVQGDDQRTNQESAGKQKKQAAAKKGAQKVPEPMKIQNGQDTKDKKAKGAGKAQKQKAETTKAVGAAKKQQSQEASKVGKAVTADKVKEQEENEEDDDDVIEEEDEDEEMYSDESELEFESDDDDDEEEDEEEEDSFIDDEAEEGEETDESDEWELIEGEEGSEEESEGEGEEDEDEPTPPKKRKIVKSGKPAASPRKNIKAVEKAEALKKNTPKSTPSKKPQMETTPVTKQGTSGKPKAAPKQKGTPRAAANIPQKATPKSMGTPKASSTPMPTTPMTGVWKVTPGQKSGGKTPVGGQKSGGKTPVGKKAAGKGSKPSTPMSAKGKRKRN
ncbi:uncharacterized protein LOC144922094 isoform X2 [Branchiostoma floridae x Branchiostoma belcheri]